MKLLVLGGTHWVGRDVAVEAVARGHLVTTFSRGTKPTPDGTKALIGDRIAADGLEALRGHSFDAVVDTWGHGPAAVQRAVEFLVPAASVRHFTYMSSRSVHDRPDVAAPLSEASPVIDVDDPATIQKQTPGSATRFGYANDKRRGELAAESAAERGGRGDGGGHRVSVLICRPGFIYGPREYIGRLPWWLRRMERGGPTLAPGTPTDPAWYIDARDLANFVVDGAEKGLAGTFLTMPRRPLATMGELLGCANEVTGGKATLRWVDGDILAREGVKIRDELPVWLGKAWWIGDGQHDFTKAYEAGLRTRPFRETVADTWEWMQQAQVKASDYLDPSKELRILELTSI